MSTRTTATTAGTSACARLARRDGGRHDKLEKAHPLLLQLRLGLRMRLTSEQFRMQTRLLTVSWRHRQAAAIESAERRVAGAAAGKQPRQLTAVVAAASRRRRKVQARARAGVPALQPHPTHPQRHPPTPHQLHRRTCLPRREAASSGADAVQSSLRSAMPPPKCRPQTAQPPPLRLGKPAPPARSQLSSIPRLKTVLLRATTMQAAPRRLHPLRPIKVQLLALAQLRCVVAASAPLPAGRLAKRVMSKPRRPRLQATMTAKPRRRALHLSLTRLTRTRKTGAGAVGAASASSSKRLRHLDSARRVARLPVI